MHGAAVERPLVGQEVEQDHTEREDVGAPVDRLAGDLLGRHEVGGADELAVHGQVGGLQAGDAEIGDLGRTVASQDDVGRFDVPVDDTERVGVVERGGDVGGDPGCLRGAETVTGGEHLLEVPALDVLHRDVDQPRLGVLADVVDRDDTGMVEAARGLRLADEALSEFVGVVGVEIDSHGFQRHPAIDDRVPRPVDHAHGASTQRFFNLIAADPLHRHCNIVADPGGIDG